jgi:hypothetical protein
MCGVIGETWDILTHNDITRFQTPPILAVLFTLLAALQIAVNNTSAFIWPQQTVTSVVVSWGVFVFLALVGFSFMAHRIVYLKKALAKRDESMRKWLGEELEIKLRMLQEFARASPPPPPPATAAASVATPAQSKTSSSKRASASASSSGAPKTQDAQKGTKRKKQTQPKQSDVVIDLSKFNGLTNS